MDLLKLGMQCDVALENEDLIELYSLVEKIENTKLDDLLLEDVCQLEYTIGNLYVGISCALNEELPSWRNGEFPKYRVKAINSYRRARALADVTESPLFAQITTNLAIEISQQGRAIEAISNWNMHFASTGDAPIVAAFSKAQSLKWLTYYINDPGHVDCYLIEAYKLLKKLDETVDKKDHPKIFNELKNNAEYRTLLDHGDDNFWSDLEWDQSEPDYLYSYEEKQYRSWCLMMGLFANDLNDLTNKWIADQDILQFPTHNVDVGVGPYLSSAFSAIKREFCFARFLAYEGINNVHPKFENKNLFLADTYDGVKFEGEIEKIKAAFRISFSALDSIATLLDQYFKCESNQPSFSPIWIKKNLNNHKNPFVDALYWLACDLTDASLIREERWKAPNPESGEIRRLRNAIEHGWLRVVEFKFDDEERLGDYAHIISSEKLKHLTIDILLTVRAALQYVCFAVKYEEVSNSDGSSNYLSQTVPLWEQN